LPARRAPAQLGLAVTDYAGVDGAPMRGEHANVAARKSDETKQEMVRRAEMQPQE
jgi:hypothetical protein